VLQADQAETCQDPGNVEYLHRSSFFNFNRSACRVPQACFKMYENIEIMKGFKFKKNWLLMLLDIQYPDGPRFETVSAFLDPKCLKNYTCGSSVSPYVSVIHY